MDDMTWFLIGVLVGVGITIMCTWMAFGRADRVIDEQREQIDDWY